MRNITASTIFDTRYISKYHPRSYRIRNTNHPVRMVNIIDITAANIIIVVVVVYVLLIISML